MAKFKVTGRMARISSGTLELSEDQASVRMHCLKHLKGNRYEVLSTIEFKHGEELGYVGELPKAMFENLTDKAEADAAAKKLVAQAEAEAKAKAKQEAEKAAAEIKARREEAMKEWSKDPELRKQFGDDVDSYLDSLEQ